MVFWESWVHFYWKTGTINIKTGEVPSFQSSKFQSPILQHSTTSHNLLPATFIPLFSLPPQTPGDSEKNRKQPGFVPSTPSLFPYFSTRSNLPTLYPSTPFYRLPITDYRLLFFTDHRSPFFSPLPSTHSSALSVPRTWTDKATPLVPILLL